MSEKLTEEKLAELREAFELFDADNDGKITTAELSDLLRKLGYAPTQKQVEAMIKAFDEDGDGTADLQEFIHLMTMRMTERDELLEAFRKFDMNQDGYISKAELKIAMTRLGVKLTDDQLDEVFHDADTNNDSRVSYEEFAAVFAST